MQFIPYFNLNTVIQTRPLWGSNRDFMCIRAAIMLFRQEQDNIKVNPACASTFIFFLSLWWSICSLSCDLVTDAQMNTLTNEMGNKWKRQRERKRKWQKPISQQGRQVANYGAEYGQSSLSGFQAECTMLFLRNHFGHPLHCPFQNVLSTLVLSMEQPSHNSLELGNWLTASLIFSKYPCMYLCCVLHLRCIHLPMSKTLP